MSSVQTLQYFSAAEVELDTQDAETFLEERISDAITTFNQWGDTQRNGNPCKGMNTVTISCGKSKRVKGRVALSRAVVAADADKLLSYLVSDQGLVTAFPDTSSTSYASVAPVQWRDHAEILHAVATPSMPGVSARSYLMCNAVDQQARVFVSVPVLHSSHPQEQDAAAGTVRARRVWACRTRPLSAGRCLLECLMWQDLGGHMPRPLMDVVMRGRGLQGFHRRLFKAMAESPRTFWPEGFVGVDLAGSDVASVRTLSSSTGSTGGRNSDDFDRTSGWTGSSAAALSSVATDRSSMELPADVAAVAAALGWWPATAIDFGAGDGPSSAALKKKQTVVVLVDDSAAKAGKTHWHAIRQSAGQQQQQQARVARKVGATPGTCMGPQAAAWSMSSKGSSKGQGLSFLQRACQQQMAGIAPWVWQAHCLTMCSR